jgi:hypothetical protein
VLRAKEERDSVAKRRVRRPFGCSIEMR